MRVHTVKLIPLKGPGAPSPWRVVYGSNSGDTPAKYPKVELPEGSGAHLIVIELSGNHEGITFAPQDPMSVKAGSKPGVGSTDPQIAALGSTDGKQLFVLDSNQTPGDLHYALDMVGHADVDPILQNGGRGFVWGNTELLLGAAVFLVIGLSIMPLYRALFGR